MKARSLFLTLGLLLVVMITLVGCGEDVGLVEVPDIHGMLDPDPVIRAAGLVPEGIPIHGPIEPDAADYMEAYRQEPAAGSMVPKGSTVTYHYWWEQG